jgi:CO/xanthine dehydrogenase Mo-binding subunit
MIAEGQLVGGAAHGIGNALYEWMGYDDEAQPLTTTYRREVTAVLAAGAAKELHVDLPPCFAWLEG